MKFKAKQRADGTWAVFTGKKYFTGSVTPHKRTAEIEALHRSGRWYQDQIDKVDARLDELGAFDHSDPHGYMC